MPKDTSQAPSTKYVKKNMPTGRPYNRPDSRAGSRGGRNLKAGRKR